MPASAAEPLGTAECVCCARRCRVGRLLSRALGVTLPQPSILLLRAAVYRRCGSGRTKWLVLDEEGKDLLGDCRAKQLHSA